MIARPSRRWPRTLGSRPSHTYLSTPLASSFENSGWLFELLIRFVPIHQIPPSGDVFRAAILILEIVSVFPDVQTQDGFLAVHERAVLIRGGQNLEFRAAALDEPSPSGTEPGGRRGVEFFFERIEAAKVRGDYAFDFAFR